MATKPKFSEKSISSIRMMELIAIYASNMSENAKPEDMSEEDKVYILDRVECIIKHMQELENKIRG